MANISLKKDYQDGQVLYGSDLNANNDVTEQGVNDNYRLILELQQDKADVSNVAEQVQELQTQINNKVENSTFNTTVSDLETQIENKVENSTFNTTVSDLETQIENKVDKEEGKGLSSNDYTDAEKEKLASLENYDDTEIKSSLNNKADRSEIPTKVSQLENDENFVDATYVNNAIGNLELPVASETVLGGIKVGDNLTVEPDGTLNATGGSVTDIPIATENTLGGIKVGDNLTIEPDGTLNATGGGGGSYVLPPATETTLGGVKVGTGLHVEDDGTLSTTGGSSYELPVASQDTLGGIKVGDNLEIESDGTLNAKAGGTKTYTEQPIPPYNVGDLWTNGEELYVCQTAKADGEEFASLDWKLTTNYASQITNINQTVDGALEDIASLNTSYNNLNNNLQTNYTPTEQIDAKNEEQDEAIQDVNNKIIDLENKIENQTQLGYLLFTKGEFEGKSSTDIYWVGD